ncbi:MAG: FAD-dependent oxidoreductase [Dehalococcoidia bacterium]
MATPRIRVYGAPWCPDCRRAKQFLGEQRIPYQWIDIEEDEQAQEYVRQINQGKSIIPTILFEDGSILVEPTNAELAQKLGLQVKASRAFYDLIVVGAGPSGLTAALYAAREGIDTLVIERAGIGGQAGTTEWIENYPGFPEGVAGSDLAQRLKEQATRFGVEILPAQAVTTIGESGDYRYVRTEAGDEYCGYALLLATGSRYRRLQVPGEEDFIGAGVHFCATCDGPFYKGREVMVVGGGNSGLQEGLFLTKFASKVTVVEVMDRLMGSQVLQEKVQSHPQMEVRLKTSVVEFRGNGKLGSVVVKDLNTEKTEELRPAAAFVFIGLDPNTEFLKDRVQLDQRGFVATSETLETSLPGVFTAGDCRAGSTKQIASAAGEGATVALMIRHYLERLGERRKERAD